ncbi:ribonuclease E/G [Paracoccus sediminicola]|uniref:ribonuclease E/G n=1 Tax=Paracoccus sediminicola TaxID=3017783 RepID=UPI0022EFFB69|nr:ribonuclease E/G [Paracoccus sediminicola]WBU57342.1 ribonuclease E/G [Paracoccus sediminicola]
MKGRQIIIGALFGREAAALFEDGRLEDLALDPGDAVAFAPGAILRGKVNRLVKGQGGVFVTLPDGANGYLRDRSRLREGQPVLVQVSGVAEPGKAVPLSTRLLLRGRFGIVTPGVPGVNVSRAIHDPDRRAGLEALGAEVIPDEGTGLILRSAAADADDAEIRAELEQLVSIDTSMSGDEAGPPELLLDAPSPTETAWRDWAEPPPDSVEEIAELPDHAADAVRALLSPRVDLPGGAFAMIEPTRALVAIDVNTGPDHSPAAGLKANIALARDLPRQLRLRGLGGQVVIDFAPISKRERGTLEQEMRKAFRRDGRDAVLTGWTSLGLFEMTRKRDRAALSRLLKEEP